MAMMSCNDKKKRRLSPRVSEILQDKDGPLPVWVRPPSTGVEHFSGQTRAKLYQLAADGKIVTRSLRDPGQVKGCRVFLLKSVLEYIESCPAGLPEESGGDSNHAEDAPGTLSLSAGG